MRYLIARTAGRPALRCDVAGIHQFSSDVGDMYRRREAIPAAVPHRFDGGLGLGEVSTIAVRLRPSHLRVTVIADGWFAENMTALMTIVSHAVKPLLILNRANLLADGDT
jgi:hypothetical protein